MSSQKRTSKSQKEVPKKKPKPEENYLESINSTLGLSQISTIYELKRQKSEKKTKLISQYFQEKQLYQNEGTTIQTVSLIKKTAWNLSTSTESPKSLVNSLFKVKNQVLLNELEVCVWCLYIEKFAYTDKTLPLESSLLYSAFAVKEYFNDNVNALYEYLSSILEGFSKNYNDWSNKWKAQLTVNPKELNTKFKAGLQHEDNSEVKDYNFYVDEILNNSQISQKALNELVSDRKIMQVYSAYKNSYLQVEQSKKQVLQKLDSVISNSKKTLELYPHCQNVSLDTLTLQKIDSLCDEVKNSSDSLK